MMTRLKSNAARGLTRGDHNYRVVYKRKARTHEMVAKERARLEKDKNVRASMPHGNDEDVTKNLGLLDKYEWEKFDVKS